MSDTIDLLDPNLYGVLPSGFSRMRFPEIRQAIVNTLQARTGLVFETRTDSITGQFIDVFAEREATLWEMAETVYHAMYPISAFGVSLDHAVSFAGVVRLFAEPSTAWCACYGVEGTLIDAGAIIQNGITQDPYVLDAAVEINRVEVVDIIVTVNSAVVGVDYWIMINGTGYSHIAIVGDTPTSISNALRLMLMSSGLQVTSDAADLRIWTSDGIPFSSLTSTNIVFKEVGSKGNFTSTEFARISADIGELNQIVTLQTGWERVNNLVPGKEGRALETDDELRLRYAMGVYRLGGSQQESIKQNLIQNVRGVSYCEVYENQENTIDSEGRLPHSIEVVIVGGDPVDIATEIFRIKAAGIDTNGTTVVDVPDSSGHLNTIKFNRPVNVYIWVTVGVELYNEEEYPGNGDDRIKDAIVTTGNSFGIGKDVIRQRLLGPVFNNVSGIGFLDIRLAAGTATTMPAPGAFTTDNIAIDARELSQFDLSRVSVVVA